MNWRKVIVPGVLILVLLVFYRFRFLIFMRLMTPVVDFDPEHIPPAPDYQDLKFWAMHPDKDKPSIPVDGPQVFWIHPTTYRSPLQWNENLDDKAITDRFEWTRKNQASLFSNCCEVHAPHYRQATLAAYWKTASGYQARSIAYADVRRAFDHFLNAGNRGRPFVIAGHSQGAEHGLRLLRERIAGTRLQRQLVAAYLIGIPIHQESLKKFIPEIPVCSRPDENACLIGWTTFKEKIPVENFLEQAVWPDESGYHKVSGAFVCVNPVSWLLDGLGTSPDQHQGAYLRQSPGLKLKAQCAEGVLRVNDIDASLDISMGGNYHLHDYALFYYDIEKNVRTRWAAFPHAH